MIKYLCDKCKEEAIETKGFTIEETIRKDKNPSWQDPQLVFTFQIYVKTREREDITNTVHLCVTCIKEYLDKLKNTIK